MTLHHRQLSPIAAVASMLAATSIATAAQPPPALTSAEVFAAWKQRMAAITSLRFEWTEETVDRASAAHQEALLMGRSAPPDMVLDRRCTLVIDGARMRYTSEGPMWSLKKGEFVNQPYVATFDGEVAAHFFAEGVHYPKVTIFARKAHPDVGNIHLKPILLSFRALDRTLLARPRPEECVLAPQKGVVDGQDCIIVELAPAVRRQRQSGLRDNDPPNEQWWSDASKGYAIVRYMSIRRGRPQIQVDISYKHDVQWGWIPESWRIVRSSSTDTVVASTKATVRAYALNTAVEPSEFRIEHRPGMWVEDRRDGSNYVIRQDGTQRPVLAADIGPGSSYEAIMNTEPGMARSHRRWTIWQALLVANGAALACLGVYIAAKRWRRYGSLIAR